MLRQPLFEVSNRLQQCLRIDFHDLIHSIVMGHNVHVRMGVASTWGETTSQWTALDTHDCP
jgi:hypothetical protein